MREKVLFDIDYTLIDTRKFKESFKKKISEFLGISVEDLLLAEQGYVKKDGGFTDFVPQEYIDFIADSFNSDKFGISKAFFDDENFADIVFPDVYESLETLSKILDLGIFSEGFRDFQLLKLYKTGIFNFFNENLIFIFRRKLTPEALNMIPKGCFIVDDSPSVISVLKEKQDVRPIWLNRKTKEEHDNCKTIFSLDNFEKVLKNYSSK